MILSKAKFAHFCGYSTRQVSKWIDAGMPAKQAGRKGVALRIDSAKAVGWLLGRADEGGDQKGELAQERKRLVSAQAKNAELAYQQKIGELIPIEDLQTTVNEGTAIFVGQKRSMGSRLAGKLAGMTSPTAILKLLNAENDKILNTVADKLQSLSDQGTP